MIDIHCHILPGIDDGPGNLEDSILMAKKAVEEGITTIIATPHHRNGRYENPKKNILLHVDAFNQILASKDILLTILPGQEPRIFGELLQAYLTEDVLTLNNTNRYLFIELPSNHVPRYAEELLFQIQLNGLTPIIVHPERNQEIIENPKLLYNLVKKGACSQVTGQSITGHFGKKIKKFTFDLIDANLAHFVASDAHNTTNRTFRLREAYGEIEEEFGTDHVYMFRENAELLVKGKTIYKERPTRIRKKKLLGMF